LSDSSVNCYGFRLLTNGYQIDEYRRNPVGYYMHQRESGVMVRWEDLSIKGDRVTGCPVINLSNERGQQTADEIESGFLLAASMGDIVVLEYSDAPEMKKPGQTGPTITKWYNKECSVVDVPGNANALALMHNKNNMPITLANLSKYVPLAGGSHAGGRIPAELYQDKAALFERGGATGIKLSNPTLFAALMDWHYHDGRMVNGAKSHVDNASYLSYMDALWANKKSQLLQMPTMELYHSGRFYELKAIDPALYEVRRKELAGLLAQKKQRGY